MGASAREIEQQIKATRERIDDKLGVLQTRAATGRRRYGTVAAVVAVSLASVAAGFVVWRKMRQPSMRGRIDALGGRLKLVGRQPQTE